MGWGKCCIYVADLPSKKSSLQKVFGLNLHLKNKEIEFNPLPPYQYIRASRENFSETDLALKLEPKVRIELTFLLYESSVLPLN